MNLISPFYYFSKTNSAQISIIKKKNLNNKAHSSVVCHRFVGNLLGVGVDVTGRMNCSVCQMKLFIAGKHPKQTRQPGADISICVDKEHEEETVWLSVDVRHLTGRLKAACVHVCPCECRWGDVVISCSGPASMSALWPERLSDPSLWSHSL